MVEKRLGLQLTMSALVFTSLCPLAIKSQTYVKGALCTLLSGGFVALNCPRYESAMCRIQAFKLYLLNCRAYPCINYNAPQQNSCTTMPFGCPFFFIRIFGLCPLSQMCCAIGGLRTRGNWPRLPLRSFDSGQTDNQQLTNGRMSHKLTSFRGLSSSIAAPNSAADTPQRSNHKSSGTITNLIEMPFHFDNSTSNVELSLPSTAEEYLNTLPYISFANATDPRIVEEIVKDQYVRFMREVNAVNKENLVNGDTNSNVNIPPFEEFRDISFGLRKIMQN